MNLTLIRDEFGSTFTRGVLQADGLTLQTIELSWWPAADGSPGGHSLTSCVPPGAYELRLHSSAKHPRTWALHNPVLGVYAEPGDIPPGLSYTPRTDCLIHPDNVTATLEGCIGPGLTRGTLNGEPAVLSSVEAFAQLQAVLPWTAGHTLTISGAPDG